MRNMRHTRRRRARVLRSRRDRAENPKDSEDWYVFDRRTGCVCPVGSRRAADARVAQGNRAAGERRLVAQQSGCTAGAPPEHRPIAFEARDPSGRRSGYTLRSGRRVLGSVTPTSTRGVYAWTSNVTRDRGVTTGLDRAIRLVLREAGVSPRQYAIDLVDAHTGKRRQVR